MQEVFLHNKARSFNHNTLVHKFGENRAIDTSPETIWSAGGLYPWSSFDSGAQTIYAKSSNSGDTGDLTVQGLDANYNLLTETKTLTGTGVVTLSNQFLRIFRLSYENTTSNAGTITTHVTSGSGTVVGQVEVGDNQSLMCVYTVPTKHRGYLTDYTLSVEKSDDARVEVLTRSSSSSVFQIKSVLHVYQTTFNQTFPTGLLIPEKTDIEFRCTGNSNGSVSSCFNLVLQHN